MLPLLMTNICVARLRRLRTLAAASHYYEGRTFGSAHSGSGVVATPQLPQHLARGARAPVTSTKPTRPAGHVPGRQQTKMC
eukprot:6178818-Pleurochrysis_carterae.AAC.2